MNAVTPARAITAVVVLVGLALLALFLVGVRHSEEIAQMRAHAKEMERTYQSLVDRAYLGERIYFARDSAQLQNALDSLQGEGGTIALTGTRYFAQPHTEWYRGKVLIMAMRDDDIVPRMFQATEEGMVRAREYVGLGAEAQP